MDETYKQKGLQLLPAISEHLSLPRQLTTPKTASKMPPASLVGLYHIDLKADESLFGGKRRRNKGLANQSLRDEFQVPSMSFWRERGENSVRKIGGFCLGSHLVTQANLVYIALGRTGNRIG